MAVVTKPKINLIESDNFESNQFSIKASSEAFRILSDGLYSDKVKAVIRELSTNAVDSIIEAGAVSKGYDIHLPDQMNPYFYIRDYGIGLDHKDVMELYTTYFHTDKTGSNKYVGQLGLGSKSPFAYTDNFSITSYKDGTQRSYTACINEEGYPTIKLLDSFETSEPNGLKVQFGVNSSDFTEFHDKADRVYQWFDPNLRPNVINHPDWDFPEIEYRMGVEGDWLVLDDHNSDPVVVMGNIAYPIKNLEDQDDLSGHHTNILNVGVALYFDIGDLQITPSREALSLTKSTVKKLIEKLDKVVEAISQNVSKEFENCKSLWEARVLASSLFGDWQSPLYHLNGVCKWSDIKWNDRVIHYERAITKDIDGVTLDLFTVNSLRHYGDDLANARRERVNSIPVQEDVPIFENDLERGSQSRCRAFAEEHGKNCWLVNFNEDRFQGSRDEFLEHVGFLETDIKKASDLPKPLRSNSRSSTGVRKDKVFLLRHISSSTKSGQWDNAIVEFGNSKGLYVKINRYNVIREGNRIDYPGCLQTLVERFVRFVGKENLPEEYLDDNGNLKVHGVKHKSSKPYDESEDWVDAIDFMEGFLKENYLEAMEVIFAGHCCHHLLYDIDEGVSFIRQDQDSLSGRYSSIINGLRAMVDAADRQSRDLRRFVGDDMLPNLEMWRREDRPEGFVTEEQLHKLRDDFNEKYPMLALYHSFAKEDEKIVITSISSLRLKILMQKNSSLYLTYPLLSTIIRMIR